MPDRKVISKDDTMIDLVRVELFITILISMMDRSITALHGVVI